MIRLFLSFKNYERTFMLSFTSSRSVVLYLLLCVFTHLLYEPIVWIDSVKHCIYSSFPIHRRYRECWEGLNPLVGTIKKNDIISACELLWQIGPYQCVFGIDQQILSVSNVSPSSLSIEKRRLTLRPSLVQPFIELHVIHTYHFKVHHQFFA